MRKGEGRKEVHFFPALKSKHTALYHISLCKHLKLAGVFIQDAG